MPRYVSKDRLLTAILALADWRARTQSQGAMHLFPLLSLLAKGVNPKTFTKYEESDDFEFFDKYFRVSGNDEHPYFDPLVLKRRIETHPHSNVATARKGTFERSWQAAESKVEGGHTLWKLNEDYAGIVQQRVMTRGGETTRASALDIALWFFRNNEFPDNARAKDVLDALRSTIHMDDEDFDALFEFRDEAPDKIFGEQKLSESDVREIVESTLFGAPKLSVAKKPTSAVGANCELTDDDPILTEVRSILALGSSGIIFRGCPGTGKSWYAWNIALSLVNNHPDSIFRVQFHPSYGYEDFVEGYRPNEHTKSGFEIVPKTFLEAVEKASGTTDLVVYIIDEINRGDPSRVFGEVLTYIEQGWRDVRFAVPYSGRQISIPRNLVLLATMNPHDRSITQLDMAMLRRFDHVDIHPSKERVQEFVETAGMKPEHASLVVGWFDVLQRMLPFGLGHTYFLNVGDMGRLSAVWRYRISPFCESVLAFEPDRLEDVKRSFESLQRRLRGQEVAGG